MPKQEIGGLTVLIDRLICVGFEDCVTAAPNGFEMDGDGVAVFAPGASTLESQTVLEAARACPVDAIVVLSADGTQLHP